MLRLVTWIVLAAAGFGISGARAAEEGSWPAIRDALFAGRTLEDGTGVGNIIVRPDFYDEQKMTLVNAPFLIVEGIVQTEDGVTAVRAEKVWPLDGLSADAAIESHDFH